jgi:hypothetical protein
MSWRPTRREREAYEEFAQADARLGGLTRALGEWAVLHDESDLAEFRKAIGPATARRDRAKRAMEVLRMTTKAKELRETFRKRFRDLANEYHETQSDRYPQEFRDREGARVKQAMRHLEAQFQNDLILWQHSQRVEVAKLRASDPPADTATEMRRLREQIEVSALVEQYPSAVQGRNILLPEAWRLLSGGNAERAQVYVAAAQRVGAHDGRAEQEINRLLDATVPHRKKAVELDLSISREVELARIDLAEAKVEGRVGTPQELSSASTAAKVAAYQLRREDQSVRAAGFDPGDSEA